jgi:hypothetical protein
MMEKESKFEVFHLFLGVAILLLSEGFFLNFIAQTALKEVVIIIVSILGAAATMYIAIQAIEKVNSRISMLTFLFFIILEFITFFAFEYWYLVLIEPGSFPTVGPNMLSLLLHSTMAFVLNPLYLPGTEAGEVLLLVNTLSALAIVLFILQNIWQLHHLRRKEHF